MNINMDMSMFLKYILNKITNNEYLRRLINKALRKVSQGQQEIT